MSKRENFFPREARYIISRHQIKLIYILHSFFYSIYKLGPIMYWDPQMLRHLTGLHKSRASHRNAFICSRRATPLLEQNHCLCSKIFVAQGRKCTVISYATNLCGTFLSRIM